MSPRLSCLLQNNSTENILALLKKKPRYKNKLLWEAAATSGKGVPTSLAELLKNSGYKRKIKTACYMRNDWTHTTERTCVVLRNRENVIEIVAETFSLLVLILSLTLCLRSSGRIACCLWILSFKLMYPISLVEAKAKPSRYIFLYKKK